MILCRLAEGPARVSELEETLDMPQAAVSKQLSRLRKEGIVACERSGRSIIYNLNDERAKQIVDLLYQLFCSTEEQSNQLRAISKT